MDKLQNLVNQTAAIVNAPERLHPPEAWWSRHQPFLAEKCGYMLRPRYHPAWVPSWYSSFKNPRKCEDGIPMPVMQGYHWMDAIRMVDNEPVTLKRVKALPYALQTNRSGNPKTNGSVSREQSRGKRKHYKRDLPPSGQSQTYIHGNGSKSFKSSNSNTSIPTSANEERANFVEPDPPEVQILNMLSSKHYDLPINYCARLIDVFDISDDNSGNITDIILVLPFLRTFNDPPFLTIGEGLDFIRQALDALSFLHSNNIAHKDCGASSFMYDPSYIYPEGYHPVMIHMSRDLRRRAKHHSRTEFPPRYYITNFSYAKLYDRSEGILDHPVFASDTSIPEYGGLEYSNKHDPFAADVYLFGNMLKKEFLEDKHGFEFLTPLIESMTDSNPARRPKIKQCAERFFTLCAYIPKGRLRKRFVSGPEGESEKILNSVSHMFRNVKYSMLGIPPAYLGQYAGKAPKHYDGIESPFLWGKLGETTWRVSCELIYLCLVSTSVSPPHRSHSFSHARPAEWKTEFARQQKMHRMQLEGRTHEGFPFNTQPQNPHEARVSRREQFLINQQPSQSRGRTASDSGYYHNPRISSASPEPIQPPSIFTGKRTTPTYTPGPPQTYIVAPTPTKTYIVAPTPTQTPFTAYTQRREYYPPPGRANTNDDTDTTHIESISSVTQTRETFVENGNGDADRDGSRDNGDGGEADANMDINGDVSHLDLGLDVPTGVGEPAGPTGTRTPKRYRLLDKVEKDEQEAEIGALTSKLESERAKEFAAAAASRSRSRLANSGTVRSTESSREDAGGPSTSRSTSKIKSKSKPTPESISRLKQERRDSVRTRGTDEFKMMFPEPEALSPVLSPMYQINNDRHSRNREEERVASPVTIPPHSPVRGNVNNVPASLLTGPSLTKREGSIHSIIPVPASQVFEDGTSPVDNVVGEEGRRELNGARLAKEGRHEGREEDKQHHRQKHKSGDHHRHESRDDSPKRERSTKWDCVLCSWQLSSRAESIEHMQSKHGSYYICLHCGSYYTTAQHLKLHKEKRRHMDADESRKHKHRDGEYYEFPNRSDYDQQ